MITIGSAYAVITAGSYSFATRDGALALRQSAVEFNYRKVPITGPGCDRSAGQVGVRIGGN